MVFKGVGSGKISAYGFPPAAQLGQIGDQRPGHTPIVFAPYILDKMKPAIWIAGAKQVAFEDLVIRNRAQAIKLGVSATGLPYRGQVGNTARYVEGDTPSGYISFKNTQVDVFGSSSNNLPSEQFLAIRQQVLMDNPSWASDDARLNQETERRIHSMVGPGVHTEWAFKIWFDHCDFNSSEADINSDDRAAILIDGRRPGANPGLIRIHNCLFKNGNVKYYTAGSGGSIYVRDCLFEGIFDSIRGAPLPMPVPVHILNASLYGSALVENVGASDAEVEADVKVEGRFAVPDSIVCINVGSVIGPATIINTSNSSVWQNKKQTLTGSRQIGFWQGRVAAQHDSARRIFSPVSVRFKNLMPQDPQEITRRAIGDAMLTTNVLALDGIRRAFNLSPSGNGLQSKLIVCRRIVVNQPVNAGDIVVNKGDIVIAGVWARAATSYGFLPAATSIVYAGFHDYRYRFEGIEESALRMGTPLKGDGEWEWLSVAGKVSKDSGFDTDLEMAFFCLGDKANNITYSHDFYAPILLYIPKSEGISDNEMYELRQHLSAWPDNVEPGTVSLLRGQDFALQKHIVSKGTKPVVPTGAHDPGLIEINGNDISGQISVKAGSVINDGTIATLEFSEHFRSKARILLTAANYYAGTIPVFVESSEQKFSIHTTTITSGRLEQDSVWNYFVIE